MVNLGNDIKYRSRFWASSLVFHVFRAYRSSGWNVTTEILATSTLLAGLGHFKPLSFDAPVKHYFQSKDYAVILYSTLLNSGERLISTQSLSSVVCYNKSSTGKRQNGDFHNLEVSRKDQYLVSVPQF